MEKVKKKKKKKRSFFSQTCLSLSTVHLYCHCLTVEESEAHVLWYGDSVGAGTGTLLGGSTDQIFSQGAPWFCHMEPDFSPAVLASFVLFSISLKETENVQAQFCKKIETSHIRDWYKMKKYCVAFKYSYVEIAHICFAFCFNI